MPISSEVARAFNEQVGVVKMGRLLGVIRQSGEKNLIMVEAYLIHLEKAE